MVSNFVIQAKDLFIQANSLFLRRSSLRAPDAVIHLPFDSPDVSRILTDLNGDPGRLRPARRNNVREVAPRHDWLHRIRVVFDALGLAPTEAMQARAQRLDQIASQA